MVRLWGCLVAGIAATSPARADDTELPSVDLRPVPWLARAEGWQVGLGRPWRSFAPSSDGGTTTGPAMDPAFGLRIDAGPTAADDATWPVALAAGLSPFGGWAQSLDTRTRASVVTVGTDLGLALDARTPDDAGAFEGLFSVEAATDQRFFPTASPLYLGVRGSLDSRTSWHTTWGATAETPRGTAQELGVELGVGLGAGRTFDVGPSTRWLKLVEVLQARGVLVSVPDDEVGDRVLAAWFQLRNEMSDLPRLAWTERILEEAGLLARPFDTGDSYVALAIIQDSNTAERPSGWTVGVWVDGAATWQDLVTSTRPEGSLVPGVAARWAHLLGPDELVEVGASQRFHTPVAQPLGWSATHAEASWERWFFGRWQDPLGGLRVSVEADVAAGFGPDDARGSVSTGNGLLVDRGGVAWLTRATVGWERQIQRATRFGVRVSTAVLQQAGQTAPGVFVAVDSGLSWGVRTGRFTSVAVSRPSAANGDGG